MKALEPADAPRRTFASSLVAIGVVPFLMGTIGLAFCVVFVVVLIARPEARVPWAGLPFFSAVTMMAAAVGLSRMANHLDSETLDSWRGHLEPVATLLFGIGLVMFGPVMDDKPAVLRWGMTAFGVLIVLAAGLLVAKKWLGWKLAEYVLVQEGLLFRSWRSWHLYSWDNIGRLELGEYQRNPAVIVTLVRDEKGPLPPVSLWARNARAVTKRQSRFSQAASELIGADVLMMESQLPVSPREFLKRAVETADARELLPSVRELADEARILLREQ